MSRYRRIIEYLSTHPWALQRPTLEAIAEIVGMRAEGVRLADEEIAARVAAARTAQGVRRSDGVVGIIPIYGVIMPRANLMTAFSGGTTVDGIRSALRTALADEEITRIVFDIDSPGGSVEGIPELADEIFAARGQKPMTAIANYTMASAAYFLGAQADEVVASPSSLVGSIGVYGIHYDQSGFNEQVGVLPTYISAGKYKVEANPDQPLSDVALQHLQESVDYSYDQFAKAVAAARGVRPADVRNGFGEGRALDPVPAKAAGLVDRIATLDEVLASKPPRMRDRSAEGELLERVGQKPLPPEPEPPTEPPTDPPAIDEHAFDFERERRAREGKRPVTSAEDSAGAFLAR